MGGEEERRLRRRSRNTPHARRLHGGKSEFFVTREQWPPLKVNRFRAATAPGRGKCLHRCTSMYKLYNVRVSHCIQ